MAEELGGLRPRGPVRPEPIDLSPAQATRPDVAIFSDPGLLGVGLTLQHPVRTAHSPDTHISRVQAMHETLAFTMFHARLNQIAPRTAPRL
jgi:hypothetical protein